jgi:hypothetical protein
MRERCPKEIVKSLESIFENLRLNEVSRAEEKIAQVALDICQKVEGHTLCPANADKCFLALYLHISDNYSKVKLRPEIHDLLCEGMIIHDYGKSYGADLKLMKAIAERVLTSDAGTEYKPLWGMGE